MRCALWIGEKNTRYSVVLRRVMTEADTIFLGTDLTPCPPRCTLSANGYSQTPTAASLEGGPPRGRNDSTTCGRDDASDRKVWYRRVAPAIIPGTNRLVLAY
jgi:hypothetical protein